MDVKDSMSDKSLHKKHKKKSKRYFDDSSQSESKETDTKTHHMGKHESEIKVTDLSKIDLTEMKQAHSKSAIRKRLKDKEKKKKNAKRLKKNEEFLLKNNIPKEKLKKYMRGHAMDNTSDGIKTKYHQKSIEMKEKKYKQAVNYAARAELLLKEDAGYLEAEEGEETNQITQHEIAESVDIMSAQKYFELSLKQFGPYRMNYTRNGRHLLIGGGKGHIAAMDWQTKKLMCEMNVMETVSDVKWLHTENMFAAAQKQWVYIYDNQGIELHCLKMLDSVLRMEFLPYHFLLVTANAKSYLSWLDVSIGQKVAGFPTGLGRLDVMCQNPHNAIVHLGHSGGTVSLWSPNVKEPLVKMLCHGGGTRSIAVNHTGQYMATSGIDRTLKIWDLRMYKTLQSYKIGAGASHLAYSQRGLLAAGIGNVVEVYRDSAERAVESSYMSHRCSGSIQGLQFCPYEDVLGIGHGEGFSSILIPGSGEPNFDALEANPYQTKKQRREAEVKMLLEKVQPDMINLDTSALGKVDTKTLEEQMEEKKKLLFIKPQTIDFEPKYKKKGKSKTGKVEKRKQGVKFEHKQKEIKEMRMKKRSNKAETEKRINEPYSVFSRFKSSD